MLQRLHDDQGGAVAVIVAICLIAFFGAAALAIDVGSGFATKRDLVIDLDSAALAGAQRFGDELRTTPGACPAGGEATGTLQGQVEDTVGQLVAANGGLAEDVVVAINCQRRTVRVEASQPADMTLAGVSGVDDLRAGGYSIARVVPGRGGDAVPLSLCAGEANLKAWLDGGMLPGVEKEILFGGKGFLCDGKPGNWGWWGSNDNATLVNWIKNGMPPVDITLHQEGVSPSTASCRVEGKFDEDWCEGGPGVNNALVDLGERYAGTGEIVTLLVHDEVGPKGGSGATYRPDAFLDVRIVAVKRNPTPDASVTIEFVAYRTGPGESLVSRPTTRLCSVDGAPAGDPNCAPT